MPQRLPIALAHVKLNNKSSMQRKSIRKFCPLGCFCVLGHFGLKNGHSGKIVKIFNNAELYQVFMYSFLCQNVVIFPRFIDIIHKKN